MTNVLNKPFQSFPTRIVEEYFKPDDLDIVAERFFNYLTKTDNILSEIDKTSTEGSIPGTFGGVFRNTYRWLDSNLLGSNYIDYIKRDNNIMYYLEITNGLNEGKIFPIITTQDFGTYVLFTIDGIFDKNTSTTNISITAKIHQGTPKSLRTIHYMDLMNQTVEQDYREPYFILADVSDYASYKYQDTIFINNEARINTASSSFPANAPYRINFNSGSESNNFFDNKYYKNILYIRSFNNTGYNFIDKNTIFPTGISKNINIRTKNKLNDETIPYPFDGYGSLYSAGGYYASLQIIDWKQGNIFSDNNQLTGRGTISLDIEEKQEKNYKITVNTLPVFLNWAYFVINYLSTGSYIKIME